MSLRQAPQLSPQRRAAARQNAQHSTGPRSPAGKLNSKMNALRHGERAAPENHSAVMRALGEDPQAFANLKQQLLAAFGPGDALWERQIDDLARLYWRRDRLERAQQGLMRRAWLEVEEWQEQRRREMEGASFDSPRIFDISLSRSEDPGVQLRMLLSYLGVVRAQVKQRHFRPRQQSEIETFYRGRKGWRPARLCRLLDLFWDSVKPRTPREAALEESCRKAIGDWEPAGEPQYQELLRLLEEEIAAVEEQLQWAEKVNEEKVASERDACLAPAGEQWKMLLRREETLDRAIDRKTKLLLSLRQEAARRKPAAANQKADERSRKVIENTEEAQQPSTPRQGLEAPELAAAAQAVPPGTARGHGEAEIAQSAPKIWH